MSTFCTTTSLDILMVDTTFNSITTQLCSSLIIDAENEIRKRLSKRYDMSSVSFQTSTSVPPMVTTLCEWLTMGYMYENLSRGGTEAFGRADRFLKKAYDNLDDILNYKANITNTLGAAISEGSESMPMHSNSDDYTDTFDEADELSWTLDGDKASDIADSKD